MSDLDNLRVRVVKLPAALTEAMVYHGLRGNVPELKTLVLLGWAAGARVPTALPGPLDTEAG